MMLSMFQSSIRTSLTNAIFRILFRPIIHERNVKRGECQYRLTVIPHHMLIVVFRNFAFINY